MFRKVDPKQSFSKMEEEILAFWKRNKIFEKSVQKNPTDKLFIFYEGPPTANGAPGLHHVLARAFKDVIPRYKTMKGYRVERKAGWDTHGLPVEIQVEKELGLKNKQEIENIIPGNPRESIIEFNKKCKESVWKYKNTWEKLTHRMGYWVDTQNPYITYSNEYIESVWWQFAQIFDLKTDNGQPMVYKGHKVVPYCYRCGTALSSHEVAQGYQTIKDDSAYIKFKVKKGEKIRNFIADDNTYLIAWTTTPWTLPGNVALAIRPNTLFSINKIVDKNTFDSNNFNEKYIIAKEQHKIFQELEKSGKIPIVENCVSSDDLYGVKYEALFKIKDAKNNKNLYTVIPGGFVTLDSGTGIVHIAPAFGEDDARVGKENDLPTLITINEQGEMTADVPGKGIPVKKKNDKNKYIVDELIIEDLKKRNLWFKSELYEHEYPFCWRCDTPLIYYAKPSWFIRMSELTNDLIKNNEKINWIPEHIKNGRFGEWLNGVKDWAISRERYWGTPLPIWKCDGCEALKVVKSMTELEKLSKQKIDDLHKPYVDEIEIKCSCGKKMKRVLEVMDVWFDSGAMPLAQFSYPNKATKEDKKKIESGKYFPADYISEAIDQTRGWFYTLHAIATLLQKSKKVSTGYAYKNVICLGHIMDAKGKKMSKSKGNVVEPMDIMCKYGADMLRWMLFTLNQPGLVKKFDIKNMDDVLNRVFRMLWNSYAFFILYANIDGWKPDKINDFKFSTLNLLDRWILYELNLLIEFVDYDLDKYDIYGAAKKIEIFIDYLSNWYIRRSRKRFWKSENDKDKNEAYQTLHRVLIELSKLMAPFTPFITEEIYRNLTGEESVHLADFPNLKNIFSGVKKDNLTNLIVNMQEARKIVSDGLKKRAEAKIKIKQPLEKVIINDSFLLGKLDEEFIEIIKEELNVKKVVFDKKQKDLAVLDIKINKRLKLEGQAREIIRHIQKMRKKAGYEINDRIEVNYSGLSEVFEKFGKIIAKEVLAEKLEKDKIKNFDWREDFIFEGKKIAISVKKWK